MRHIEGCGIEEIAKRMEKTRGAIAVLIHRGLSRLRAQLAGGS